MLCLPWDISFIDWAGSTAFLLLSHIILFFNLIIHMIQFYRLKMKSVKHLTVSLFIMNSYLTALWNIFHVFQFLICQNWGTYWSANLFPKALLHRKKLDWKYLSLSPEMIKEPFSVLKRADWRHRSSSWSLTHKEILFTHINIEW